jgi:hypothetical protein
VTLHLGRLITRAENELDLLYHLRSHNALGILLVFVAAYHLLTYSGNSPGNGNASIAHTALNICLFPPLFFFSALYYTDVISVLAVLQTQYSSCASNPLLVVVFGLLSLTLRQTNIFWTAVYLGGFQVIRTLKANNLSRFPTNPSFAQVARLSWQHGSIYDPPVVDSWFQGKVNMPCIPNLFLQVQTTSKFFCLSQ